MEYLIFDMESIKIFLSFICGLCTILFIFLYLNTKPPDFIGALIVGGIFLGMTLAPWMFSSEGARTRATLILPWALNIFLSAGIVFGIAIVFGRIELPLECGQARADVILCLPINFVYLFFGRIGAGLLIFGVASYYLHRVYKWNKKIKGEFDEKNKEI